MRALKFFLAAIVLFSHLFTHVHSAAATEAERVTVKSSRGVSQDFLFVVPDNPKAGVILFVGGDGMLNLSSAGKINKSKTNFFSRTYMKFAEQGLMVALVDVPSDMGKSGAMFRISKKHATDMLAVIGHMKKKADVPIWLVGTSMGSLSAASVGIKKQAKVDGMVLTSSISRPEKEKLLAKFTAKYPDGVAGLNLQKFKKPALIMSHADDTCAVTPPADAAKIKSKLSNSPRLKVVLLKGEKERKSGVCEGLSRHGFYGIESEAVKTIADFIIQ